MKTSDQLTRNSQPAGVVTGVPLLLLRAEAALVLTAATTAYSQSHANWWLFALLFFAPDIFMLGYLRNTKWGAIGYNIGHTYLVPAALWLAGWFLALPPFSALGLIWIGHIGFDRLVGYGLKYQKSFKHNHLSAPAHN